MAVGITVAISVAIAMRSALELLLSGIARWWIRWPMTSGVVAWTYWLFLRSSRVASLGANYWVAVTGVLFGGFIAMWIGLRGAPDTYRKYEVLALVGGFSIC